MPQKTSHSSSEPPTAFQGRFKAGCSNLERTFKQESLLYSDAGVREESDSAVDEQREQGNPEHPERRTPHEI